MASKPRDKPLTQRTQNAALRRTAIIEAALDEFSDKGFAAARMEDIARRAGVAKGTIYLHFNDKEALFEAIIRQEIRPRIDAATAMAAAGGSLRDLVDRMFVPVIQEMVNTRRGAVLRLLIGEAGRFPKLAEVYFNVVIEPGLVAIRLMLEHASARGELRDDSLLEFPQLLIAPMLFGVIWSGLFERFRHLDVNRMAQVYFSHMLSDSARGALSVDVKQAASKGVKVPLSVMDPKSGGEHE